ncbi:MAG: hypothetical protein GY778_18335, partial [bacterium]|nr:hypothetical protein [bacterium]
LDTDGDVTTGFADRENGFDVLVEGDGLFKFLGTDQNQWSWQRVGTVRRTVKGSQLLVRLPVGSLVGADFELVVRTLTAAYKTVDRIPDAKAIHIDLASLRDDRTLQPQQSRGREAAGDTKEASRDLTAAAVSQKGGRVVIEVRTREAGDFAQLLVFFDTDGKVDTGYRSGAVADRGFDALLSGGRLLRFGGAKSDVWAWEAVADAVVTIEAVRFNAEFDAGHLETQGAQVVIMMMSGDWQTAVDMTPDEGAIHLRVDTTRIKGPKKAPQVAAPRENRHLPPRKRLAEAESFYCYYGSGKVAALSHYDIVIAHSPQMQPADIAKLQGLGVVVVGYLSVGEDSKLRQVNRKGPGAYASWYFDEDEDGQPDQNGIWKSYYANANDPAWRSDRLAEARRLLAEEGYDGIFLDTIGTSSAFPKSEPGMIKLIQELRAALPDAPIILNQGFPLLDRLAPLADGLMIESFTATYDFQTRKYVQHSPSSLDWTRGVAERFIRPALEKQPFKVLVLDYALPDDRERVQGAADRAATFGYLFAAAPINLDAVYDTGIRGRPDPKWLAKLATPDTLKYTLDRPANGFPRATVLLPSGCYSGYRVSPVVDGIRDRDELYWADAAWASAEDGEEAWLELRFPKPLSSGKLRIQWAVDSGQLQASRRYVLEVLRDDTWVLIHRAEGNTQSLSEHALPDKPFDAIRIRQPAGGGSVHRPDLMWIAQLERRLDS